MKVQSFARLDESIRPYILECFPHWFAVKVYSSGRAYFAKKLVASNPVPYLPPKSLSRKLWGIDFRSPVFNAAGMFKNGEGYNFVAAQGAGAFLAGTSTAHPRAGNTRLGISNPFLPLPKSHSAINWLGLPNDGDATVAQRISKINKVPGCPIGASVALSPGVLEQEALSLLIEGMFQYCEANVDFLEVNESCPNTESSVSEGPIIEGSGVKILLRESPLYLRLRKIKESFIDKVKSRPVIIKLSTDTPLLLVPELIDIALELGFSGINFGNTSTAYAERLKNISEPERAIFNYFTSKFGGGVSGRPLKSHSLKLIQTASSYLKEKSPSHEFHLIRTGGVENAYDIKESLTAGASLVQWFTGYFENFSKSGNNLYRDLYQTDIA